MLMPVHLARHRVKEEEEVPKKGLCILSAFVINILRSFGVNRAIGFGVLTRMWGALAGPLTIFLIATRLTKVEQGYYYTFSSLLALQVFFELGLLTVLAQFVAHEFAFLSWGEKGEITGSKAHRDRFVDLLGKGFKWYTVSAVLLIIALIPAGLYFFTRSTANVVYFTWRLPWALAVIGVGCNVLLIPFYAVITGSGDVASINRREMMGGMAGSIIGWLVIRVRRWVVCYSGCYYWHDSCRCGLPVQEQATPGGNSILQRFRVSEAYLHYIVVGRSLADAVEDCPFLDFRIFHLPALHASTIQVSRAGCGGADGDDVECGECSARCLYYVA